MARVSVAFGENSAVPAPYIVPSAPRQPRNMYPGFVGAEGKVRDLPFSTFFSTPSSFTVQASLTVRVQVLVTNVMLSLAMLTLMVAVPAPFAVTVIVLPSADSSAVAMAVLELVTFSP